MSEQWKVGDAWTACEDRMCSECLSRQLQVALAEDDRLTTLLARAASYLDYMEERGYSSVRVIRSDIAVALHERGQEPIPYAGEIEWSSPKSRARAALAAMPADAGTVEAGARCNGLCTPIMSLYEAKCPLHGARALLAAFEAGHDDAPPA